MVTEVCPPALPPEPISIGIKAVKIAFEANVLTSPYTGIAKSLINLIKQHCTNREVTKIKICGLLVPSFRMFSKK